MKHQKKAVVGIIPYRGRILIGKHEKSQKILLSGRRAPIGGSLINGEDYVAALKREIMEEAGIEVEVLRHIGQYINLKGKEIHWYECNPLIQNTKDVRPGSDVVKLVWIEKRKVPRYCGRHVISQWPDEVLEYFTRN